MKPTVKKILEYIGNDNLNLYKGEGYWYFVYDDKNSKFETLSIYTYRLNDMGIERWISYGRDFVTQMEQED